MIMRGFVICCALTAKFQVNERERTRSINPLKRKRKIKLFIIRIDDIQYSHNFLPLLFFIILWSLSCSCLFLKLKEKSWVELEHVGWRWQRYWVSHKNLLEFSTLFFLDFQKSEWNGKLFIPLLCFLLSIFVVAISAFPIFNF